MTGRVIMAAAPFAPPPLRWFIGVELARYRQEAGFSMAKASSLAGITKPKISHLETGRQHQSAEDITRLLSTYGAERRNVDRLIELAEREGEANWWLPWSDVVAPWLTIFVGLERLADRAFTYQPTVIPGLLQTRDYAAVVAGESPLVRADHIKRVAEFRIARAARLTDPDRRLWLHAVIGAGALDRVVRPPDVYEAQMVHLARMADLPTVTIQVLPADAGSIATHVTSAFTLLNLDAISQVGYVELLDDAVYLHERGRLQTYEVAFKDLQREALDPERSLALIRSKIV